MSSRAERGISFQEHIREAAARGAPLRIRGGGSKDFYGGPLSGDVLDTTAHAGIVAYEPTELYVTARCGTKVDDLERALEAHDQMLAFEPPQFGGGATVGGMVAAGLSGPRRAQCGAVRDFVLGIEVVDGRGETLRFGGRVMKNVAGYDVSRLMAGSLGTLALITEVTLKVLPRPAAELTLRFELTQEQALARFNQWAGRPLPISASAWHEGIATLRLSGGAAGLAHARAKLGGEAVADVEARDFWQSLRDHTHSALNRDAPLYRLAVPSTTPPLDLPGDTLIEWTGGQRWLGGGDAAAIRAAASKAGGHAVLFRSNGKAGDVFDPLPRPALGLHRRLKKAFDPQGVFAADRLYADL